MGNPFEQRVTAVSLTIYRVTENIFLNQKW